MEMKKEYLQMLEDRLLIAENERRYWINEVVRKNVKEVNDMDNVKYHRACGKLKLLNDMIYQEVKKVNG